MQWKLIRINGDGSFRLIYNGTCPENNCTISTTGTSISALSEAINPQAGDNKHVGFMFGGPSTTPSTTREDALLNETSSNIKTKLEAWYETSFHNTEYEEFIAGLRNSQTNTSHYLYTATNIWTMTPYYMLANLAYGFRIESNAGMSSHYISYSNGIRPVINIDSDIRVTGTGLMGDPFKLI